jgi:hypothetical protein
VGVGVAIVCRWSDRLTLGRVGGQARACSNTLFLKVMMKPTFCGQPGITYAVGLGLRNGLPKRRNPQMEVHRCFTTSPLLCRMAGYATDTVVTLTAVPDESKRCVGWRGTCTLALGPTSPCMLFHVLVDSQAHRGGAGLSRSFGEGPRTSIPDYRENAVIRCSGLQRLSYL